MKKSIAIGIFLVLAAGVAGILFLGRASNQPVLVVNDVPVAARDYTMYMRGFERYRALSRDTTLDPATVKRAALMTFIIDTLTRSELERRGLAAEAVQSVDAAVAGDAGKNLAKAALELYGWDVGTLRRFTLEPQARQDVLSAALEKDGAKFRDWLQSALTAASVRVYGIPYTWEKGSLVEMTSKRP